MNLYIYIYILALKTIYIYSGKPETVHQYWPVSEIYRTTGQTGTASDTVLTLLVKVTSTWVIYFLDQYFLLDLMIKN